MRSIIFINHIKVLIYTTNFNKMQKILVEIESLTKAKELTSMLLSMNFIKKVSTINKNKELIEALQEHENIKATIVKNKNKAIEKYL